MSQQPPHSEELSLLFDSVELKNLRYSESIIEGQRLTVELFERHLFMRIS